MNLLIDIGHPAHVHYFRNLYAEMSKQHKIIVTCKTNPVVESLLKHYQIDYITLGHKGKGIYSKLLKQLNFQKKIHKLIKQYHIDFAIGTSASIVHASLTNKAISIVFDDDDQKVQPFTRWFVAPFAGIILSPDCLKFENLRNAFYYPGYHELAYLHPNRFAPDKSVPIKYGIADNKKYFILRFNAFTAHHDIGMGGMSIEQKRQLIKLFSAHGKIFITTEKQIDEEFEQYQCPIAPHEMHSFLNYATMFISDSQTMTSEAAVLGVPSFRCNSFVGKIAYLDEEEKKYGLTYGFLPEQFDWMLKQISELLTFSDLKNQWQLKREAMLKDKIDVTSFWIWFIENHPNSVKELQNHSFNFNRFR